MNVRNLKDQMTRIETAQVIDDLRAFCLRNGRMGIDTRLHDNGSRVVAIYLPGEEVKAEDDEAVIAELMGQFAPEPKTTKRKAAATNEPAGQA